jgi:hypothetical protein
VWILAQYYQCLFKKKKFGCSHEQREDQVRTEKKDIIISKPRRKTSERTIPDDTLILIMQLPFCEEINLSYLNKFKLFKPYSLWYFVMAMQTD